IDNRYTRLDQLMAEADQKIKMLQSAVEKESTRTAPGPDPVEAVDAVDAVGPDTARTLGIVSEAQRALTRLRQERGAPPPDLDPAYQPIYLMSDAGKSVREIAQELGRQPGEIELILALRQRQPV